MYVFMTCKSQLYYLTYYIYPAKVQTEGLPLYSKTGGQALVPFFYTGWSGVVALGLWG